MAWAYHTCQHAMFFLGCMSGFSSHVHGVVQANVAERTLDMFFIYLRQVRCVDCYQNEAFCGHKGPPLVSVFFRQSRAYSCSGLPWMTGSGGHVHNACQASLAELQYMSVRPKTNLEMHVSTIHFKQVWIVYILLFCRHVYRYHIELTFFKTGLINMALTMSKLHVFVYLPATSGCIFFEIGINENTKLFSTTSVWCAYFSLNIIVVCFTFLFPSFLYNAMWPDVGNLEVNSANYIAYCWLIIYFGCIYSKYLASCFMTIHFSMRTLLHFIYL